MPEYHSADATDLKVKRTVVTPSGTRYVPEYVSHFLLSARSDVVGVEMVVILSPTFVAVFGTRFGCFLRGLLVWFADQDLHLVHVGAGRAGMLQTPFHHGARRDLHILIDRGALLVGGQFGELIVMDGIVIEFTLPASQLMPPE